MVLILRHCRRQHPQGGGGLGEEGRGSGRISAVYGLCASPMSETQGGEKGGMEAWMVFD